MTLRSIVPSPPTGNACWRRAGTRCAPCWGGWGIPMRRPGNGSGAACGWRSALCAACPPKAKRTTKTMQPTSTTRTRGRSWRPGRGTSRSPQCWTALVWAARTATFSMSRCIWTPSRRCIPTAAWRTSRRISSYIPCWRRCLCWMTPAVSWRKPSAR